MSQPRPKSLAELVRERWSAAGNPGGPDIADLLGPHGGRSLVEVADAAIADAEERWERSLPARLDDYLTQFPELRQNSDACRGLLMAECSRRPGERVDRLRAELHARLPHLADEIDAVLELVELMRSAAGEAAVEASRHTLEVGSTIGKYRLVEWLGAGAFGEVWCAWDGQLERYVALKLLHIHAGASPAQDDLALQRVLAEAQAAAALDHENIVKVHAAGRLADPRGSHLHCYIDCQLVGDPAPTPGDRKRIRPGRTLAQYADRALPPPIAARIIRDVARGVAAAHARGIVHRDIKPSNILLTAADKPLITDFGLSIALPPEPARDGAAPGPRDGLTITAHSGRVTGTPSFMSPEQARGEHATPASDIYSLGATLRYLLLGKPPFEPSGRLHADPRWDIIEQVRRGEPPPLGRLAPGLSPDLVAICHRAMAREPQERYITAQSFADDLDAFLNHRPTIARPPGIIRAAALATRRHRALALLSAAFVMLAAVGLWQYVVSVGRERDRARAAEALARSQLAETERARASTESINLFLQDVVSAAQPGVLGVNVTVPQAVRFAARSISGRFAGDPLIEADVRATVGETYARLADRDLAKQQLQRAIELRRTNLGPDAGPTIYAEHMLAMEAWDGSPGENEVRALRALLERARSSLGDEHSTTLIMRVDTATAIALSHGFAEAAEMFESALASLDRKGEQNSQTALAALRYLATIRGYLHETDASLALTRSLVERQIRAAGEASFPAGAAMFEYATSLSQAGRHAESAEWYRRSLSVLEPLLPTGHPETFAIASGYAGLLAGHLDRAQEGLDRFKPHFDAFVARPDHDEFPIASGREVLGVCYLRLGRFAEAEAELLNARRRYVELMKSEQNSMVRKIDRFLAETYRGLGQPERAEEHARKAGNPPGDKGR